MLQRMGAGVPPTAAIEDALREPLARFVVGLPSVALADCPQGILVSAARTDGLRVYYAYGFRPQGSAAIAVDGEGQHYAFRAVTDRYGVYAGTLGTPMAGGSYVLQVTADTGEHAQIALTLGDPGSVAQRGCAR
jgi:hypothetical protein